MKERAGVVRCATWMGSVYLNAILVGPFGVHRHIVKEQPVEFGDKFRVTHIGTGMSIGPPCSEHVAFRLARMLVDGDVDGLFGQECEWGQPPPLDMVNALAEIRDAALLELAGLKSECEGMARSLRSCH